MFVLLGRVLKFISATVQPYHHLPDLIVREIKFFRRYTLLKYLTMHLVLLQKLNTLPPLNIADFTLLLN